MLPIHNKIKHVWTFQFGQHFCKEKKYIYCTYKKFTKAWRDATPNSTSIILEENYVMQQRFKGGCRWKYCLIIHVLYSYMVIHYVTLVWQINHEISVRLVTCIILFIKEDVETPGTYMIQTRHIRLTTQQQYPKWQGLV